MITHNPPEGAIFLKWQAANMARILSLIDSGFDLAEARTADALERRLLELQDDAVLAEREQIALCLDTLQSSATCRKAVDPCTR